MKSRLKSENWSRVRFIDELVELAAVHGNELEASLKLTVEGIGLQERVLLGIIKANHVAGKDDLTRLREASLALFNKETKRNDFRRGDDEIVLHMLQSHLEAARQGMKISAAALARSMMDLYKPGLTEEDRATMQKRLVEKFTKAKKDLKTADIMLLSDAVYLQRLAVEEIGRILCAFGILFQFEE